MSVALRIRFREPPPRHAAAHHPGKAPQRSFSVAALCSSKSILHKMPSRNLALLSSLGRGYDLIDMSCGSVSVKYVLLFLLMACMAAFAAMTTANLLARIVCLESTNPKKGTLAKPIWSRQDLREQRWRWQSPAPQTSGGPSRGPRRCRSPRRRPRMRLLRKGRLPREASPESCRSACP
ncbi:MAG: hypothetical protein JWN51_456 [Phycisphaerales bacterium]|nr:hypothetical protein [Phycisphaerales bacterium]